MSARKTPTGKKPICTFCGGTHHSKRDYQECRQRRGKPEPQASPAAVALSGSSTTHYENDALKGDPRAHGIERKARRGMPPRKIAKHFGIALSEVEEILGKRAT